MQQASQQGMAITAVIMLSGLILLGVLMATSFTSLGTRNMVASERAAYQALLAAESGTNTLAALTADAKLYKLQPTLDDFNAFLSAKKIAQLPVGRHGQRSITFLSRDASRNVLILESQGEYGSGAARKRILQDISYERPTRSLNLSAAFTSQASSDLGGNSSFFGESGLTAAGTVGPLAQVAQNVTIPAAPGTQTFELTVNNSNYFGAGNYVSINGSSYLVKGKLGAKLTLQTLEGLPVARNIASGSGVSLIPAAALGSPVNNNPNQMRVNDASLFVKTNKIYVGSYQGTVTATDKATNVLSISWSGAGPTSLNPVKEGTPVRRDIMAAASGNTVNGTGSSSFTGGVSNNDPNRVPAGDALFTQTFGMSKTELIGTGGVATRLTSIPSVLSGVNYYQGSASYSSSSPLCGSGIFIVEGSLKVTSICKEGFTGILYVIGSLDFSGNGSVGGAVVVEGSSTPKVTGTGQQKVYYDPAAILDSGYLLTSWVFRPVAGTWRQK